MRGDEMKGIKDFFLMTFRRLGEKSIKSVIFRARNKKQRFKQIGLGGLL